AQTRGEGEADVFFDVDLHDAVDFQFDGVFGGDDFDFGGIEFGQAPVEGGGLTGTGGPGDEEDAVGLGDDVADDFERAGREAEFFEVDLDGGAVEDTHHDAFAEERGHGGDADIDFGGSDFEFDTGVLG